MNHNAPTPAPTHAPPRLIGDQMNPYADPTRPLEAAARMRPLGIPARPRRGDAIDSAGRVRPSVPRSTSGASVLGWHLDHDEIPVPSSAMTARLGR